MDNSLHEKLKAIENSLPEIEKQLSEIDISKDQKSYAEMAKKHSDVSTIVELFVEWKDINLEIDDAELYDGGGALRESASPEKILLTAEIKKVIFSTMESLPEDLRLAINFREIEGLSYEEIATIMECPVGTVRSRIFRARDAIDKKIRPLLERNN